MFYFNNKEIQFVGYILKQNLTKGLLIININREIEKRERSLDKC